MWFDGQRQPNTIYVANTSRGKDSTAMLRAIQLMGWPLDMICSVDIWATQDIPAELPPMVKFKDEYDQKVLDWFGVPVTRLCATKRSQNVNAERERESGPNGCPTQICSTQCQTESMQAQSRVSPEPRSSLGARNSKWIRLTYEDIFYRHISTDRKREREREKRRNKPQNGGSRIYGFPQILGTWCQSELKRSATQDSRIRTVVGVQANSKRPLLRVPNFAGRELVYSTQNSPLRSP